MTSWQADFLRRAVRKRLNIVIAGATSSGKTTLANALLQEIAATGDRVIVLEDTVELQCAVADHVALRSAVEELTRLAADVVPTPDADQLARVLRTLRRVLSVHAVREERALAPVTLDGVGARRRPAWSRTWYRLLEAPVLDLDALPASSVAEVVLRRLTRLRIGESVEVRCSRNTTALRATLSRRGSARFRETELGGGPHGWRSRITRLE